MRVFAGGAGGRQRVTLQGVLSHSLSRVPRKAHSRCDVFTCAWGGGCCLGKGREDGLSLSPPPPTHPPLSADTSLYPSPMLKISEKMDMTNEKTAIGSAASSPITLR